MSEPSVVVHPDAALLAEAAAARLVTALLDAQASRGRAAVGLTGGGLGIAVLEAVRRAPAQAAVDWSRLDVWWGDERFVARDSEERNELQARRALLDHVPLDPARVHPMGWLGGPDGDDVDAAARRYADELATAEGLDVLLLGMGPEGHVASIFPDSPAAHDDGAVVGVRDCPKPPPTRVSLGFRTIQQAGEVWLVVAGAEKAVAVARALGGADQVPLPAAGARGRSRTRWLLDEAAAGDLRPA